MDVEEIKAIKDLRDLLEVLDAGDLDQRVLRDFQDLPVCLD